ncbi:unnamed protein product [Paramecium pentaurelia]|uniref:Transmembrane protein n=1 Tax=Paramecium pentaurelia TaxID=43138 RepID=A0A8S1UQK9_9CILI|nr:unnamed protein product [Paramecium pentaurelia]
MNIINLHSQRKDSVNYVDVKNLNVVIIVQFVIVVYYKWIIIVHGQIHVQVIKTEIISTTKTYLLSFQFSYLNIIYALICIGNYVLVVLLIGFLKYHLNLLQKNQTTLEDIISKNNQISFNIYDIDPHTNIVQIFGQNKILWLFPIYSGFGCDDGNSFPKNDYKVMQTSSPQVISVFYEQQYVSSDKNKNEYSNVQTLYKREIKDQ